MAYQLDGGLNLFIDQPFDRSLHLIPLLRTGLDDILERLRVLRYFILETVQLAAFALSLYNIASVAGVVLAYSLLDEPLFVTEDEAKVLGVRLVRKQLVEKRADAMQSV